MLAAVIFVVFPFCMVHAAVTDLTTMTIANRVSILLAATFLVVAPLAGMPWPLLALHVAAGLLVLFLTFALFAMGTIGGGDAKLLSATALWMGMGMELAAYVFQATLLGGLLTLAIVIYRNSMLADVTVAHPLLRHLADRRAGVPYGIALGAAGLLTFPQTWLFGWAMGG